MNHIPLSNPRKLLDALDIKPSKALGQSFLKDKNILKILLETAALTESDQVLEIGPGLGFVTEALLERVPRVVVIEKDKSLSQYLQKHLSHTSGLRLIECDALDVDLEQILVSEANKIIANLPYSVGSRILVNVFNAKRLPEQIVVTLQLDVAERLRASSGSKEYGFLSILAQLNYEVKIRKVISPSCFYPAPKIKSAIINMKKRNAALFNIEDKPFFRELIKRSFFQRRKQISTILRTAPYPWAQNKEKTDDLLRALEIDPSSRPENISVEKWGALSNALSALSQTV
ncbi:MAG: ribosomal RNA small subunit methyltransferase A [Kiritimatiellae bacterium]|nr:ribosomal RNA small subunit methyltransferase A [Kiritimatiellia bacterium]